MKTDNLSPVYYTDVKRIDDAKFYFIKIVNSSIPKDIAEKISTAALLLQEAKSQTIKFFSNETETK